LKAIWRSNFIIEELKPIYMNAYAIDQQIDTL